MSKTTKRYTPRFKFQVVMETLKSSKEYEDQIEREYNKMVEEFERPFKEFEYLMKGLDRLAAEFDELMKISEIEEFNKMMKAYDRFFNDPERIVERIERLKQTSGRSPSEFNKKYTKQDGAKETSRNRGWWNVTTETLIVPESYLQYLSILKELKDEMSPEEETSF